MICREYIEPNNSSIPTVRLPSLYMSHRSGVRLRIGDAALCLNVDGVSGNFGAILVTVFERLETFPMLNAVYKGADYDNVSYH